MKKYFPLLTLFCIVSYQVSAQKVIVNSNPTMNDRFSKRSGSLRLSTTLLKIGKIKNNVSKTDTVRIYNDGVGSMSLITGKVPSHLTVTIGTALLASKMESWIAVTYNAQAKNDYGFTLDRFEIVTNDSVQAKKTISVSAHIQEYFLPMSGEDSINIQKSTWIEKSHDYGMIQQGTKVSHTFSVTNEGKRDLYIRKTKSNCSCMKVTTSADTIPPGANGLFTIEFDSANKQGKDSRKVNVFLNDPSNPEVILEMKGEIKK